MKKIFKSIAFALILSLMLILIKNEYARLLLSHANYGVQALITGYHNGEYNDGKGVNIYIGSSMFRKGLDINVLNQNVDGVNYILSYNGTRPFQCYEELAYVLQKGVKIRHLYVDLYAFAMTVDPWVEDSRLLMETDFAFKCRLWKDMSRFSDSPIKNFWDMFVTTGNERLLSWPIDYRITNAQFLQGGNLQVEIGGGVDGMIPMSKADRVAQLKKTDYDKILPVVFNKNQESYVKKTISLCKNNNIPITFIETPKYASIMAQDNYAGLMKSYIKLLLKNNVDFYLIEDSKFTCNSEINDEKVAEDVISFDTGNVDYFVDWLHLSSSGREEFTKNFTKALNKTK